MRKTIETYEMTRWDAHLGEHVIYTRHNSQPMTGMQDIERAPFGGLRIVWYRVTIRDDARTRYGVQIAVDKVYSDDRPADYTDDKTWVWYYMTAREAAAKALLLCRECGITDPYITGDVGGMCTSRDCEMIAAGATWDDLCTEWYKAAATVTTRERGGYNYCETVYTYSAEGDTAPQEAAGAAETVESAEADADTEETADAAQEATEAAVGAETSDTIRDSQGDAHGNNTTTNNEEGNTMTMRQAIHKAAQYVAHTPLTVTVYTYNNKDYFWEALSAPSSWIEGATEICGITGWYDRSLTVKDAEMMLRQEAGII